ncbi:MAG: enoyl-CoA hydratase/isomerase family protein [Burkholderiaceae bacterium]|nr:MAG: enoyl-CoA hydratase/isomerase family protein [Burkholderiaceae bacterium]
MLIHDEGQGVHALTLDRGDKGNALSSALVDALLAAIAAAHDRPQARALVLAGNGRHLCTGFDLSDLEQATEGDLLLRFVRVEQMLDAVWRSPLLTVALASGRTWGAGADLFCAAQQRWALPDATFRFPGAAFGLVLGTRRLAARVGADTARAWVAGGLEIDAATAQAAGLVSHVGTREAFDAHVAALRTEADVIDAETRRAINTVTRDGDADADLAALVRSAARPGLKQRIVAYRAASTARR